MAQGAELVENAAKGPHIAAEHKQEEVIVHLSCTGTATVEDTCMPYIIPAIIFFMVVQHFFFLLGGCQ